MQIFSQRLIALRKEKHLTQTELGQIIGKGRSTMSGYETEGKEPDIETLLALAKYFDVTTDYLLGYSDERGQVKQIFYNDHVNFEHYYMEMPADLRFIISRCFDDFYLLLRHDIQIARPERLRLYHELLHTLQNLRSDIRKSIENSGGTINDPVAMSDLMALQNKLKNELSCLLDKLMQADMEIAFQTKSGADKRLYNASVS